MRLLGITFMLSHRYDAFLALHQNTVREHRQCLNNQHAMSDEANSLRRTVAQQEEMIEALKIKCSRVNVSALENEVRRLTNEKMSSDGLPVSDKLEPLVLPGALVQPSTAAAQCSSGYGAATGEGFDLVLEDPAPSGDVPQPKGD